MREGDNTGQETNITVVDEKKMTEEILPNLKKDYPPAQNPELQAYVDSLGKKLVTASNLERNPYHYTFTVVDVEYVNAFALPAGTIFVTAPLISMAESEAELAGVIGHEVGHVMSRHTAERIDMEQKNQTKNLLITVAGGILGGVVGYGAGKANCPDGDKECLAKAAAIGAAVGAGGALLIQKYRFMANSREDEMEADRIGFRVATKAGYAKDEVGKFYDKLLKMEKERKSRGLPIAKAFEDAFTTHPPSEQRAIQMKEMSQTMPLQEKPMLSSDEFMTAKINAGKLSSSKQEVK
ncbi:MAG: M48 family metalloprotease [Pseudomonadota bacterium]